ncbi:hypothetical protein EYF80_028893 [Liparis tanakae]|uniref:Uncharacterized protein n=1 Tax=Liparis tanakae TaxID=230148 RepID=A0A4Z2H4W1_9TELE|nr:hypothetical protein EYF80_028893 [Liparis tanakae]
MVLHSAWTVSLRASLRRAFLQAGSLVTTVSPGLSASRVLVSIGDKALSCAPIGRKGKTNKETASRAAV